MSCLKNRGFAPLFLTGTARSGSTLLCKMIDAHPNIVLASDPFLPVFKSFRNALAERGQMLPKTCGAPLHDYYFDEKQLRIMDTVQESHLDISCPPLEWKVLSKEIVNRARFEAADCVPYLDKISPFSYREIFVQGLETIAQARGTKQSNWIGFKDVWIIEFFAPLAKAFPKARFVVIMRDPRAVIASMLTLGKRAPNQKGHSLSYMRHWRKYVAFVLNYQELPLIKNRFFCITYEQLVATPEKIMRDLCSFLDIHFHHSMLNRDNYMDYSTGKEWKGNSSYSIELDGIDPRQTCMWRKTLEPSLARAVEFVCGIDMEFLGYQREITLQDRKQEATILDYFIQSQNEPCSWRSDFCDLQRDYGFELFRQALLKAKTYPQDISLIRRSFLFEQVYKAFWEKAKRKSGQPTREALSQ